MQCSAWWCRVRRTLGDIELWRAGSYAGQAEWGKAETAARRVRARAPGRRSRGSSSAKRNSGQRVTGDAVAHPQGDRAEPEGWGPLVRSRAQGSRLNLLSPEIAEFRKELGAQGTIADGGCYYSGFDLESRAALAGVAVSSRPRYGEPVQRAASWVATSVFLIGAGWTVTRMGSRGLTDGALPVLLALLFAAGLAVIARYARRGEAMSLLSLITIFYLLVFGIGALYYRFPGHAVGSGALGGFRTSYSNLGLVRALALVAVGYLVLAGAFMAANFMRVFARLPKPAVAYAERLTGFIWFIAILGWVARALLWHRGLYFRYSAAGQSQTRGQFATMLGALSYLPLIAFAVVATYRTRHGLYRTAYWLLLAAELAWALPSGDRARIIGLGLLIVVVRYYTADLFPWRTLAVWAVIAVFVVLPFGALYRGQGSASGYQRTPVKRISVAAKEMISRPSEIPRLGLDETFSRFSDIAAVASITTQGKRLYPHKGRSALDAILEAPVPRFVLPGKVDPGGFGNDFGHAYHIVAPISPASVSETYVGDLYGSFGFAWMIVGMAILGVVCRGIDEYLGDRRTNVLSLAIYGAIIGVFLNRLETSIAVGFVESIKEIAVYALVGGMVLMVIRELRQHQSPNHAHVVGEPV